YKCEEYDLGNHLHDMSKSCEQQIEDFCSRFSQLLLSPEALGVFKVCVSEATNSKVSELFWQAGPAKIREELSCYLTEQTRLGNLLIENCELAAGQLIAMLHAEAHTRAILGLPYQQSMDDLPHYAQ